MRHRMSVRRAASVPDRHGTGSRPDDELILQGGQTEGGDAIARYEREMYDYGFGAVRDSLRAAKQFADGGPVARTIFKTVLRTASAVPALKRAMF